MTISALEDFRALNRPNVAAIYVENNMRPTLNVFMRGEDSKAKEYDTLEEAVLDAKKIMRDFPGLTIIREEPLLALNPAMTLLAGDINENCYITFRGTLDLIQLSHADYREARALVEKINAAAQHVPTRPVAVQAEGNVIQLFRKPKL